MFIFVWFLFQILGIVLIFNSVVDRDTGFFIMFMGYLVAIPFLLLERKKNKEKTQNKRKKLFEKLKEVEEYKPTRVLVSEDLLYILSVDENLKKICITSHSKNLLFDYKDILQSEIIEDGSSVTRTSRGSQLGGALIGGVLAGGVGAVIGGLSGKTETKDQIKKVQLKIVVNDISRPSHTITLLNHITELKTDDHRVKSARKKASDWHNVISIIIKRADEEDKQKERKLNQEDLKSSNISVADELLKLSELLKQNLITQEEFEKQKTKLLT